MGPVFFGVGSPCRLLMQIHFYTYNQCFFKQFSLNKKFICSPSLHRTSTAQGFFLMWVWRRAAAHTRLAKSKNAIGPAAHPKGGTPDLLFEIKAVCTPNNTQ